MAFCKTCNTYHNAGFVSTRLMGTDGVSMETEKWAAVLEKQKFTPYYFAGELDRPAERSYLVPEAHFRHPEIKRIYDNVFGVQYRERYITEKIHSLKELLKGHLYEFLKKFNIDLLILENVLAIPLNIPLGIAVTEILCETDIPAIAHHHDFFWERDRFQVNAVNDYLHMAFPPHLFNMAHVVISSAACNQLGFRTGIAAKVIPNVMEFEYPPQPVSMEQRAEVRKALGIDEDALFILQPTRVVKRKGIEHAIELVSRLGKKAKLVISHASGDEGYGYEQRIREYSALLGVDTIFVSELIGDYRGATENGRKIYTLHDIYPHADLVTYPSDFEGFGNAFLETIYFKKPIVVNTYSIYATDIKPKGFSVIELDGYVTGSAVAETRRVLEDPELRSRLVEHNYEIAATYYSYTVLEMELNAMIRKTTGCGGLVRGSRMQRFDGAQGQ